MLRSYAATYLKEEIQADALTRNLEGFARFLYVVAASVMQFLDVSKLSQEAGISYQSTKRFFEILEDTLIVYRVAAFSRSERRRLTQHPRYFFFDNGVLNGLLENFTVSEDRKGMLFENILFSQIYFSAMSFDLPIRISSYRTEAGAEVDFIVEVNGKIWAIEAKSTDTISNPKTSGLRSFEKFYQKPCELVICYGGSDDKKMDDVWILSLKTLLSVMFSQPAQ